MGNLGIQIFGQCKKNSLKISLDIGKKGKRKKKSASIATKIICSIKVCLLEMVLICGFGIHYYNNFYLH